MPSDKSNSEEWQLASTIRINVKDWYYAKYAETSNRKCYYYHIMLQLSNSVLRPCLSLNLADIRKLRYRVIGSQKRILVANRSVLMQNIKNYLISAQLPTTHIDTLIQKLHASNYRKDLAATYIRSFDYTIKQLLQHNPKLANQILATISDKRY